MVVVVRVLGGVSRCAYTTHINIMTWTYEEMGRGFLLDKEKKLQFGRQKFVGHNVSCEWRAATQACMLCLAVQPNKQSDTSRGEMRPSAWTGRKKR